MRAFLRFSLLACGLVGLAGASTGCSLSGLDDFAIPDCKQNTDCEPLNSEKGIGADACEVYQCRKSGSGCELRPRDMDDDGYLDRACSSHADLVGDGNVDCDDTEKAAHPGNKETCDGVDNDCDGLIDEGVAPKLKHTATLGLFGPHVSVAFGDISGATPRVTATETNSGRTSEVRSDTPETPAEDLAFAYLDTQDEADTKAASFSPQCPNPDGTETDCSFAEAVVTAFGQPTSSDDSGARALVAAINTLGCAHGQVRIGYLKGTKSVVLHGPEVHSNLFEGVDVNEDGCTGASRSDGAVGATHINTAGLEGTAEAFPQALSVWLADSNTRTECTGSEATVEALGVWLESTINRDDLHWTNGTNNGVPESLGTTQGDGRPAIIAVDQDDLAGYFVAYGAAGGGIALHYVPRFDEPPPYTFNGTTVRETPQLGAALSLVVAEGAAADEVSLSVTRVTDSEVELGVTWLEGECNEDRDVVFEQLTVDVSAGTVKEGKALVVAEDATRAHATSAAVTKGLLTSSFELDGEKASDTGGYLVAWTGTDGTLELARISSFTGDIVGQVVDMGSAAVSGPLLFNDGGPVLAMYSDAGEVFSGPALCK